MGVSPSSEGAKPTQLPPQTTPQPGGETLHDGAATQSTKIDQPTMPVKPLRKQALLLVVRPAGTLEFSSPVPESKDFGLMRLFLEKAAKRPEEKEFTFDLEKSHLALELRCVDENGQPLEADPQRYGTITFRRKGSTFEVTKLITLEGTTTTSEQILRTVATKILQQIEHDQRKRRAITARVADGFKTLGIDPKSKSASQLEETLKTAVLSAHTESARTHSTQNTKAKAKPSWIHLLEVPLSLMTSYESPTPYLATVILIHHISEERFRSLSVDPSFERFLNTLCETVPLSRRFFPAGQRKTALGNFIKDVRTKVNARKE